MKSTHRIIVAHSKVIEVLSGGDGSKIRELRGHQDIVCSLACSSETSRLVSGDSGGIVIVWSASLEPALRYYHASPVRSISYHPKQTECVSASDESILVWSSSSQSLSRKALSRPCTCVTWLPDGLRIIYGLLDGTIGLLDRISMKHVWKKQLPHALHLSCCECLADGKVCFGCSSSDQSQLCFIDTSTGLLKFTVPIPGSFITCIHRLSGDLILVGDKSGSVLVCSQDRVLKNIFASPTGHGIISIDVDSTILDQYTVLISDGVNLISLELSIRMVHAISQDGNWYCARENQNLTRAVGYLTSREDPFLVIDTERDKFIHHLAITEDKVAIAFTDQSIGIYSVPDATQLSSFSLFMTTHPVSILLLSTLYVYVICSGNGQVGQFTFDGDQLYTMGTRNGARIKYAKIFGPEESLIVGCEDGSVLVARSETELQLLTEIPSACIRCVDWSLGRRYVAIINDQMHLQIMRLESGTASFHFRLEGPIISCTWNSSIEGLLMFVQDGQMCAWESDSGKVIVLGRANCVVLRAVGNTITGIEPGRSHAVRYEIDFTPLVTSTVGILRRFHFASLGVPRSTWDLLGKAALGDSELKIAKLAFSKSQNKRYLYLLYLLRDGYQKAVFKSSAKLLELMER